MRVRPLCARTDTQSTNKEDSPNVFQTLLAGCRGWRLGGEAPELRIPGAPCARGARRQAGRLSLEAVGRAAATARDRAGAGHGAGLHAVRRGDLGARSGARGRGARHDAPARQRGHDRDLRHARDGISRATSPTGSPTSTPAGSRRSARPRRSSARRARRRRSVSWPRSAEARLGSTNSCPGTSTRRPADKSRCGARTACRSPPRAVIVIVRKGRRKSGLSGRRQVREKPAPRTGEAPNTHLPRCGNLLRSGH